MRLVTAIFLTIAMLAGCQMHSDEEYRNLEKSYKELKAQKFAVELERESNEKNLEIAIACNTLPINICPQDWTNINMESYLRAGYIGKPTWRYWLILIGGLIERLLAAGCIGVGFALFLKKMLEPDSAAVEEAKKTISMAKIEGDRIQERINKVAETERAIDSARLSVHGYYRCSNTATYGIRYNRRTYRNAAYYTCTTYRCCYTCTHTRPSTTCGAIR